ncbi:MAG: DNA repair exonuclease [Clostridia bacterium]|nr:DNA repair exonuclease [Clostridia bacterium]
MTRILHTGDLHLGGVSEKNVSEKCFENICLYAKENKVSYVLLCGDNFEKEYITSKTLEGFINSIKKAEDTKFIIIAGNHDYMSAQKNPYSNMELPENVYLMSSEKIEKISFDEVDFYGISYGDNTPGISPFSDFCVENDEKLNIALFHGDAFSDTPYMNISREEMRKSLLDYVAMGHIHKGTEVEREGKTYYSYCGCPQGRGFDETGTKSFIVADFEKGLPPKFMRVRSSLFNYEIINIDISNINSTLDLENLVGDEISKYDSSDVIRIYIKGALCEGVKISVIKDIFKNCEIIDNTTILSENKIKFDDKSIMGIYFRILEEMKSEENAPLEIIEKAEKMGYFAFSDEEDISWL